GFQRAKTDFSVVGRVIQSADIVSQGQAIVQQAGQASFDLVIDLEFSTYDAVKAVAPQFPNTQWMTPNFTSVAPNDTGYLFNEQDGSYLAGVLAANVGYQGAGGTGTGVIQAAQSANKYAIGVDSDQDAIAPGHVLTSMIKRTDLAVYDSINRLVCGKLKGGDTVNLGLKEGAVGLSQMKFTRNAIPSKYLDKVADLQQKIIDGQIKVWSTITKTTPSMLTS